MFLNKMGQCVAVLVFAVAAWGSQATAKTKVTFLVGANATRAVHQAIEQVSAIPAVAGTCAFEYYTNEEAERGEVPQEAIRQAGVLLVDTSHRNLASMAEALGTNTRTRIYALRAEVWGSTACRVEKTIVAYFSRPTTANIENLILYLLARDLGVNVRADAPETLPAKGFFHPSAGRVFEDYNAYISWYRQADLWHSNGSWVAVADYANKVNPSEPDPTCARLVVELERRRINVLPLYASSSRGAETLLFDEQGHCRVNLVCAFAFKFTSGATNQTWKVFQKANVPVINAIRLYTGPLAEWRKSEAGLGATEIGWQIAGPELDGIVEPSLLGGKERIRLESGKDYYTGQPIDENIESLARRIETWIALQSKSNSQKRVAIVYYNHKPGRQNVGASYLNVFRSVESIVRRLRNEGYQIEGKLPNETKIKEMVLKSGRNIGTWAAGELDELRGTGQTVEVPLEQYREWYSGLDESFRKAVETQWGVPQNSTIIFADGKFIIPCVRLGNVILLPQPSRGGSSDPVKLYHAPTVWPHHQYIAFYLWLQHGFKADAVIHLGTHGTEEWLPGKSTGLSQACAPEALIQALPNLYPYIMDNIGEGLQAKRRGRGVVIDHLTPVFGKAGAQQEHLDLIAKINEYATARIADADLAREKFARIKAAVLQLGLDKDLGLTTVDNNVLEKISQYLESLREADVPYGLHAFGMSPEGKSLEEFAGMIAARHPGLDRAGVATNLGLCGVNELDSLVRGLKGGFIEPGEGNDPLRNPDALPTGRDFYGFDPDKIPSREAYVLGAKMAGDMIQKYRKEKGACPEKIALVMWATETQRNEGTQVGTALNLLGMRPVWDRNGKVTGVEPIPGAELGRPRIDVLVQASGLNRDTFPNVILLLDKAVREAARMRDVDNFIARHSERIKMALLSGGCAPKNAEEQSLVRIFSEAPGSYSLGVQELAPNSGTWEREDEIADVFIRRASYGYSATTWGEPLQDAYTNNLAGVQMAMHTRSSNLYKTLDNDDVFGYLGGLALAVRRVSGKNPDVVIARQETAEGARIEDLERTMGEEMRVRVLNPRWIEALKKENYAGARAMAEHIENLWGWQVAVPSAVDAAKWQQVFEVYVEDKHGLNLKEFFERENVWARQSMTARMLETVRKKYWDAPENVRKALAREYALSVIEKGVACCDHTCNNPALNQMVATFISLPGMLAPEQVRQFNAALTKATGKSISQAMAEQEGMRRQLEKVNASLRNAKTQERPVLPSGAKKIEGFEVEEQTRTEPSGMSSSGAHWAALAGVLTVLALLLLGWRRFR